MHYQTFRIGHHVIEVGKSYTLINGNRITVTSIFRCKIDGVYVSYEGDAWGKRVRGDSTPNSFHQQVWG